jgi:hypothetical protein
MDSSVPTTGADVVGRSMDVLSLAVAIFML